MSIINNKTYIMINLNNLYNESFKKTIETLIGTDNEMEFINFNESHEKIALNMGLTVIYFGSSIIIKSEPCDINAWV